jgi:hypothetical protein
MNIIFIKIGDKHYFQYDGMNYELKVDNLEYIKNTITYPCVVEFYNYPKTLISQVLSLIIEGQVITKTQKLEERDSYKIMLFKSYFQQQVLNR